MNLEALQEELQERMAEIEDQIIKNRIEYMVNREGFEGRFRDQFNENSFSGDNIKQKIAYFLMDEMELDG